MESWDDWNARREYQDRLDSCPVLAGPSWWDLERDMRDALTLDGYVGNVWVVGNLMAKGYDVDFKTGWIRRE